ncbi:MAG: alpha-galactosidase, partial [Oscillospiraceae bacterium]|nr:alpha-galactosidase [Oscillospiraceae bacterium]
ALLPPERQGEFFHRFVLGTYELMDRLTKTFPDLLLENCSGGGGRFDPGMLCYSPQIWASDNTDPIERLTIQFGTSMCYPASTMGAHVSDSNRTGYETKGNVALWGTFGYELDPNKLTSDEREIVKKQVEEYHKYYDLIHYGDLYRISDPYFDHFRCSWSFVSLDKSEALATIVTMRRPEIPFFIFKFKGLDPDKYYECDYDGKIYSGSILMNAGINLTYRIDGTGDSMKIYLKEVRG